MLGKKVVPQWQMKKCPFAIFIEHSVGENHDLLRRKREQRATESIALCIIKTVKLVDIRSRILAENKTQVPSAAHVEDLFLGDIHYSNTGIKTEFGSFRIHSLYGSIQERWHTDFYTRQFKQIFARLVSLRGIG